MYAVTAMEEGREDKATTTNFQTLVEAQKYVLDRWQGSDYVDGPDGFHTDYCTYELSFTLKDIFDIKMSDDGAERIFTPKKL